MNPPDYPTRGDRITWKIVALLYAIYSLRPRNLTLQIVATAYVAVGAACVVITAFSAGAPAYGLALWILNGGALATLSYHRGRDDAAAETTKKLRTALDQQQRD